MSEEKVTFSHLLSFFSITAMAVGDTGKFSVCLADNNCWNWKVIYHLSVCYLDSTQIIEARGASYFILNLDKIDKLNLKDCSPNSQ